MSSDKSRRRWTAQEKLSIVSEGRKDGATVSEVCRRHSIAPTLFYDWERKAREGSVSSLKERARKKRRPEPTVHQLQLEIQRLKGIIAEIAAENVELKKTDWL